MFPRIRAQALVRRTQYVLYPIRNPTRALTTTTGVHQLKNHTPDSYSKDIDRTPPSDDKVHRVDAESDCVQKPYEAPSGEWSRAGVKTDEYRSVDEKKKQPYAKGGGYDKGPDSQSSPG